MLASYSSTATPTRTNITVPVNATNTTLSASNQPNLTPGVSAAIGVSVIIVCILAGCLGYRCFFVGTVTKERRKSMNAEKLEAVAPRRPSLAIRVPAAV